MSEELKAAAITEGKASKGGTNPPNTSDVRPAPPKGSGDMKHIDRGDELKAAAERIIKEYNSPTRWPGGVTFDSLRELVAWTRETLTAALAAPPDGEGTTTFTDEQCFHLNAHQRNSNFHPYTCGNDSRHRPLIATRFGWKCADCNYTQNWAHGRTMDGSYQLATLTAERDDWKAKAEEADKLLESVAIHLQGWALRHDMKPELATSMMERLHDVDKARRLLQAESVGRSPTTRKAGERMSEVQAPAVCSLPSLPPDVSDAFESFKLAIMRHRLANWFDISQEDIIAALEHLKNLALMEPEDWK